MLTVVKLVQRDEREMTTLLQYEGIKCILRLIYII